MIEQTAQNVRRQMEKHYARQDWVRDIASYERWKDIHNRTASDIAASRMAAIKGKWPGKEHLFD